MGLIKPNNYRKGEMKYSLIALSMGHPARNRVIDLLLNHQFVRNIDLPEYLNLSQAMVTKHLDNLKRAKLIRCNYHVHYDELVLERKTLDYFYECLKKKCDKMKR
jgi:predicted transcriptional regulator